VNGATARLVLAAVLASVLGAPARASAPAGRYAAAQGTVYDTKTKLTWQQQVPSTRYPWADAKTYCAHVGAILGGSGWRLPTLNELLTIVDFSRSNPSIDPSVFPATPADVFSSATPDASSSEAMWTVNFLYGVAWALSNTDAFAVRCVR
jgi:hypothetical protein